MKKLLLAFFATLLCASVGFAQENDRLKIGSNDVFKGPVGLQMYSLRDTFAKDVEKGKAINGEDLGVVAIPYKDDDEKSNLDSMFAREINRSAVEGVKPNASFSRGALVPNSLFTENSELKTGYRILAPFRCLKDGDSPLVVAVKYNAAIGKNADFRAKAQKLFELLNSPEKKDLIVGAVLLKRDETANNQNGEEEAQDRDQDALDPLGEEEVAVSVPVSGSDFQFKRGDVVGFLVPAAELGDDLLEWGKEENDVMSREPAQQ